MKRLSLAVYLSLAIVMFGLVTTQAYASIPKGRFWAVIISGASELVYETDYVCEILTTYYHFDDDNICYIVPSLDNYPYLRLSDVKIDLSLSKDNVRSAFTIWLRQRSTSNDIVFIYVASHGGGYDYACNSIFDGRIDENGDEGPEVHEKVYNQDINGDGDKDDWFGVDESIVFIPYSMVPFFDRYWDDELAQDLSEINCWRLIFTYMGVRNIDDPNPNHHCFSGGLIDNLSGPNRLLIAGSNETAPSFDNFVTKYIGDVTISGRLSCFGEQFLLALNKSAPAFMEADTNDDGRVSILEAYHYAYEHDPVVQGVYNIRGEFKQETPWLDDNGNGLPTFKLGQDFLDTEEGTMADGFLASYTFLDKPCSPDINEDGIVDVADISFVCGAWLTKPSDTRWNPAVDFDGNCYINIIDIARMARWYGQTTEP